MLANSFAFGKHIWRVEFSYKCGIQRRRKVNFYVHLNFGSFNIQCGYSRNNKCFKPLSNSYVCVCVFVVVPLVCLPTNSFDIYLSHESSQKAKCEIYLNFCFVSTFAMWLFMLCVTCRWLLFTVIVVGTTSRIRVCLWLLPLVVALIWCVKHLTDLRRIACRLLCSAICI